MDTLQQAKRILAMKQREAWESLPRYLRRAYASKKEKNIRQALSKAYGVGWTKQKIKEILALQKAS